MAPGLQSLLLDTAGLSTELLFACDRDGVMRVVNPAWARVLGWSEAELQSTVLDALLHPDDRDNTRQSLARGIGSEAPFEVQARCRHRDGSHRCIAWSLVARDGSVYGAGHDVTAGRQSAAASRSNGPDRKVIHDINNLMQNVVGALELVRKLIGAGRIGEIDRFMTSAIDAAHKAAELNQHRGDAPQPAAAKSAERELGSQ